MTTEIRDDQPASLDTVFAEVKERIAVQFDQAESLDRKAGTLLGFSSLVVTVAAGLRFAAFNESAVSTAFFVALFVLGLAFYAISVFFAFRAYAVVSYRRDPEPRPLRDLYLFEEENYTKQRIISNVIDSFGHNAKILAEKAYAVRMASRFLFFETLVLATALAFERILT